MSLWRSGKLPVVGYGHHIAVIRHDRGIRRNLSHYQVTEHVVPTQHTRHWPRGTEIGHENALKLAVKQYTPIKNPSPQPGDITFIAAHANGFVKELYEPLWDDLYEKMEKLGKRIRSIWIADVAHQGESAVINEHSLGNDPNWYDAARDLLYLINQKQQDMPQPLFGIGHSMGGSILVQLALLHPNLLRGLVAIDPIIQTENPSKKFAPASTYRRDIWPSREEAATKFSANKFYQSWDPRVLAEWNKHGLRELPTELHPDRGEGEGTPVTLKTPVAQEVFSYLRPKYLGLVDTVPELDRSDYGDMHPDDVEPDFPFYRPEPAAIFRRLPEVKPPILYIFGQQSDFSTPELTRKKLESTGTGVGGSGGRDHGKVKEVMIDAGHLIPMEAVNETADAVAEFVSSEVEDWEAFTQEWQSRWLTKSRKERSGIDDQWRKNIGPKPGR